MALNSTRVVGLSLVVLAGLCAAAPSAPSHKPFTDAQKHWWAFQPVAKPAVPAVKQTAWVRDPIDAFILAKLEGKNLSPSAPADKISLIRRASLDQRNFIGWGGWREVLTFEFGEDERINRVAHPGRLFNRRNCRLCNRLKCPPVFLSIGKRLVRRSGRSGSAEAGKNDKAKANNTR